MRWFPKQKRDPGELRSWFAVLPVSALTPSGYEWVWLEWVKYSQHEYPHADGTSSTITDYTI